MIKGGCLCRQVNCTADGEALVAVCHCKHCQKQSGTAFGLVVGVPKADDASWVRPTLQMYRASVQP